MKHKSRRSSDYGRVRRYPLSKKICCNCGAMVGSFVRTCRTCGPAIWRPLTSAEFAAEIERIAKLRATFDRLVAERAAREVAEIALHWHEDDC